MALIASCPHHYFVSKAWLHGPDVFDDRSFCCVGIRNGQVVLPSRSPPTLPSTKAERGNRVTRSTKHRGALVMIKFHRAKEEQILAKCSVASHFVAQQNNAPKNATVWHTEGGTAHAGLVDYRSMLLTSWIGSRLLKCVASQRSIHWREQEHPGALASLTSFCPCAPWLQPVICWLRLVCVGPFCSQGPLAIRSKCQDLLRNPVLKKRVKFPSWLCAGLLRSTAGWSSLSSLVSLRYFFGTDPGIADRKTGADAYTASCIREGND